MYHNNTNEMKTKQLRKIHIDAAYYEHPDWINVYVSWFIEFFKSISAFTKIEETDRRVLSHVRDWA